MLPRAQNSMATRSSPMPTPPWGGAPYLKLSTYGCIVASSIPCAAARSAGTRKPPRVRAPLESASGRAFGGRTDDGRKPLPRSISNSVLSRPQMEEFRKVPAVTACATGANPHCG